MWRRYASPANGTKPLWKCRVALNEILTVQNLSILYKKFINFGKSHDIIGMLIGIEGHSEITDTFLRVLDSGGNSAHGKVKKEDWNGGKRKDVSAVSKHEDGSDWDLNRGRKLSNFILQRRLYGNRHVKSENKSSWSASVQSHFWLVFENFSLCFSGFRLFLLPPQLDHTKWHYWLEGKLIMLWGLRWGSFQRLTFFSIFLCWLKTILKRISTSTVKYSKIMKSNWILCWWINLSFSFGRGVSDSRGALLLLQWP